MPAEEDVRRADLKVHLFLLAATVLSLAIQGVVEPSALQQVAVTGLAGATLLLAFTAARVSPRLMRVVELVVAIAVAVGILRAAGGGIGDGVARLMNAALLALGPPALAVAVLRNLRASDQVRVEAVIGVLTLYMLIGMAFGFLYGAIDRLGSGAFFAMDQEATVSHCLYFSFTTLATVGYGDFVAAGNLGHTLAVSEALIGQIYLVTVVSLVVSNLGRPARRSGGSPPAT